MYVKNCPNFCSVFRQPFSGARTDPLSSRILQNGRNSTLELHVLWKLGPGFTPEKGSAFSPSLFFSAQHFGYRPCAEGPNNKDAPVVLRFSYTKGIVTLKFSVTTIKSHSFTRETQRNLLSIGSLSMKRSHKLCAMYVPLPCPLTWFELFLAMKLLAHVHKPRSVKFIVFNGQSFSCEKDTKQSRLHSWWILKNNVDQLVNIWLYK
jgi:hypothetical protein